MEPLECSAKVIFNNSVLFAYFAHKSIVNPSMALFSQSSVCVRVCVCVTICNYPTVQLADHYEALYLCSTCSPAALVVVLVALVVLVVDLPNFAVVYKFWRRRGTPTIRYAIRIVLCQQFIAFCGQCRQRKERSTHRYKCISVDKGTYLYSSRYVYNEALNTFGLTIQAFVALIIQKNV